MNKYYAILVLENIRYNINSDDINAKDKRDALYIAINELQMSIDNIQKE